MRIIQTFWTQDNFEKTIEMKGGWLSNESFYMCWALSCLNAKKYYGNIELYTDEGGYELLINQMKLPYDKVHIVFNKEVATKIPKMLWSLSKIYTYGLQEEPFIHIDGDFIFWEKIDFENKLLFQNLESNETTYKSIYNYLVSKKQDLIENKFLNSINTEYTNKASNMGIFGCKDVLFSKQYSNNVFDFISSLDISEFDDYLNSLNIFIEQYYVFHLCTQNNFTYNTIHPDVEDYRSNVKGGFFNQPDSNNSFNHFLGNSKRYEDINDYVVKKLKEYYPDDYKRIEEITAKNISIEYYHMCDKNKFIDLDKINFEFNKKLNKFNINISTQFNDDFNTFYKTKHSYLDKISSNEYINIDKITILKKELWKDDNLNNFKIKFSNNVLGIKNYFYPWDLVFDNVKHDLTSYNLIPFLKLNDTTLETKNFYCVFHKAPFQKTIASFWVKDITAYIVTRILNNNYQSLDEIINQTEKLLKTKKDSNREYIKSILAELFLKLYNYGLIEIHIAESVDSNSTV